MSGIFPSFGYGEPLYPLAAIERIGNERKNRQGNYVRPIKLQGQETSLEVFQATADRLLMTPVQIIPAHLGTYVLRVWLEGDTPMTGKAPVVGWALCVDGGVRPLTAQGVNDGWSSPDDFIYIEMPDGSVQASCEHAEPPHYDNVEAYRLDEGAKLLADREPIGGHGVPA